MSQTVDPAPISRRPLRQLAALTWVVGAGAGAALRLASLAAGPVCAGCNRVPVDRRGGTCSPACFNRV
ncbi:hypothetical protein [Nocardioides nanhaiensis]|uniref:DUF2116 family Zn-ribbon domain-containing protein n=1 Tax=Nocardioides nanhaiensis TaxID=1476871 RepID=A0ABP8VUM8_9ACTN